MFVRKGHPLWFLLIFAGIVPIVIGVLWASFDLLREIGPAWLWVGLGLLVGLAIWGAVSARIRNILVVIGQAFLVQPLKGIAIGVLLTAVYAAVITAGYYIVLPWMQFQLGTGYRLAWLATFLLVAAALPALFVLYRVTGFPADGTNVRRATISLSIVMLALFAFVTWQRPNFLFDPVTKEPLFMVAEKEGAVYFFDPKICAKHGGCVSPETGEPLRPGTPVDAEKYRASAWTTPVFELFDVKKEKKAGKAVPFKKLPHLVAERNWTARAQVLLPRGYCLFASTAHPTRNDVRPQYSGDNGETWTSQWIDSFGEQDVIVRFRSQLEKPVRVEYDLYRNPNPGRPCRSGGPRVS